MGGAAPDTVLGRVLAGVLLAGELVQAGEYHVRHVPGSFPVQGLGDDAARDRAQVGQRGDSRLRGGRVEPEASGVTVKKLVDHLLGCQDRVPGRDLQGRDPDEVGPAAPVAAPTWPLAFPGQGDGGLAVARDGGRWLSLARKPGTLSHAGQVPASSRWWMVQAKLQVRRQRSCQRPPVSARQPGQ